VALELSEREPPLEARDDPPPGDRPRHTTRLLPLVEELLGRAGMSFDDLDRVAVGIGPGTFTGLRIGIATARALAQARALPLVGVSTLHSLAYGAEVALADGHAIETVVPTLDARRGEVFAAAWPARALERAPLLTARAFKPEALARALESTPGIEAAQTLAVGEGALAFRAIVERPGVLVPDDGSELHRVTAVNHCRLARSLPSHRPYEVHPCYLRSPDAEPARQPLASAR
jgi:tRNA threonylcarbamoyladenosine biosynthesis protein TsaB